MARDSTPTRGSAPCPGGGSHPLPPWTWLAVGYGHGSGPTATGPGDGPRRPDPGRDLLPALADRGRHALRLARLSRGAGTALLLAARPPRRRADRARDLAASPPGSAEDPRLRPRGPGAHRLRGRL